MSNPKYFNYCDDEAGTMLVIDEYNRIMKSHEDLTTRLTVSLIRSDPSINVVLMMAKVIALLPHRTENE